MEVCQLIPGLMVREEFDKSSIEAISRVAAIGLVKRVAKVDRIDRGIVFQNNLSPEYSSGLRLSPSDSPHDVGERRGHY